MEHARIPFGEQCLLRLLRSENAEDALDILRVLHAGDDGAQGLLEIARKHGLSPALYQSLRPWAAQLPGLPWESLQADYIKTAAQNALRYSELGKALDVLRVSGVRVALLKGAAMAEPIYGNVGLRPMGDVDLLIPKAQITLSREALETMGYLPEMTREARPGLGLEFENELALIHPDTRMALELHWHLLDSPFYQESITEQALWQEVAAFDFDGRAVEALKPEAMLVHVATHWVLHHRGNRLAWLYDIDQLVRRLGDALCWPRVGDLAVEWNLVLGLQVAVQKCREEMATPFPDGFRETLCAQVASPQERRAFAFATSTTRGVINRFVRDLVLMRGWNRRFRYLVSNILPSGAYMRARYDVPPGRAIWPYYGLRLLKGAWQLGASMAGAIAQLFRR